MKAEAEGIRKLEIRSETGGREIQSIITIKSSWRMEKRRFFRNLVRYGKRVIMRFVGL